MPVIQFGPWLPDQADYQNNGVTVAENVFPSLSGYRPVNQLVTDTTALTARPRGAIRARSQAGVSYEYAGDASKLYENQSGTWTDVSKAGGYSTGGDEVWEFAKWKDKILATNFSDDPQSITFGGANFADLTTAFKARHLAVVRDFVVFGNTSDTTDGAVPSRVRWSAFNDETDYTVSQSTLSDFQDLKTGSVERIFGGEFGVVFTDNSVWRMTFVGAPLAFQFDEVLPEVKLISPGAAARDGDTIYFLSRRGFIALQNGTSAKPIGAERVDDFVFDDLDTDNLPRISATVESGSRRVMWAYPGAGNTGGRPNKIIVYDPNTDRWSIITEEVELIFTSGGTATTLEQVDNTNSDIDALSISLDSDFWKGSGQLLGIFDENFKSGTLSGSPKNATIETREFEIHSGRRTRLSAFRPLTEGGSVTGQVGTRNRQIDTVSFGSSLSLRDSGRFTTRANARYHRFRLNLSGEWQKAIGVQILDNEARPGGFRG